MIQNENYQEWKAERRIHDHKSGLSSFHIYIDILELSDCRGVEGSQPWGREKESKASSDNWISNVKEWSEKWNGRKLD